MWNIGKSLLTFGVMGIPLWVVIAGMYQYQPTSLVVHLEEPDVQLFLSGQEYPSESGTLGPIELKAGDYQITVTRGAKMLFSYPLTLEEGHVKEVWARWNNVATPVSNEPGLQRAFQGAFRPLPKDWKGRHG